MPTPTRANVTEVMNKALKNGPMRIRALVDLILQKLNLDATPENRRAVRAVLEGLISGSGPFKVKIESNFAVFVHRR